jgi:hypothetical protein
MTAAVRTNVVLAAVQDDLVAATRAGDLLKRVDEVEAELTTLHRLGHGNVLDVSDDAGPTQELALDKDSAHSNELLVRIMARRMNEPCRWACG